MESSTEKSDRLKRLIKPLCLALAFWPVWKWYALRTIDSSDEPLGLAALACAAYFLFNNRGHKNNVQGLLPTVSGLLLLVVYICTFTIAPNLVQSIITLATLWFILPGGRSQNNSAGICGLLFISLPLIPSVNFYGGYPLRLVTAAGARLLLSLLGLDATQEGTMLSVHGNLVSIDAPCSGINMLWVSSFIVFLVAAVYKLRWKKNGLLCAASVLIILAGNILRASTLVVYDILSHHIRAIDLVGLEPQVHLSIGLFLFAASTIAVFYIALRLSQQRSQHNLPAVADTHKSLRSILIRISESVVLSLEKHLHVFATDAHTNILVIGFCLVAASLPFIAHPTQSAALVFEPPVWPEFIAGKKITAVPSLPEESAFARDFPGVMKRFTDGTSEYFIRVVHKETRQLHPSSDCFRGMGYSIEYRPLVVTGDGARWNSFIASKNGRSLRVMERIYDTHGQSWTDVSAWYWASALGQSKGPWWAVTMARPI